MTATTTFDAFRSRTETNRPGAPAAPPQVRARTPGRRTVAVLGAGITGVTTAYELARAGFDVTVFDRQPDAAMETSFANGGQLSASNAEVWTRWATILHGLKWIFEPGAPLSVDLMPSWHRYSWMAEFLAATRRYEANTIRTTELAIAARDHLIRMAEDEGFTFDLERRGILHIYRTQAGLDHAAEVTGLYRRGGLERHAVSPDEARAIEPTLKADFVGGYFTPSDMTGDIHKFTVGLSRACERRGVTFRYRTRVTGLSADRAVSWQDEAGNTGRDTFDAVVVSAGIASRALARQAGDRVNIYPVKGYSITVNLLSEADRQAAPWTSLLDDDAKIVTSRLGANRLRIAGTAEIGAANRDIRMVRIAPLVRWCETLFPDVSVRDTVPWAGLRPMMPDMMPKVGPGRAPGIYYNTGHGHLGWTLSAVTAHTIATKVAADADAAA